jgi:hypothetical protein
MIAYRIRYTLDSEPREVCILRVDSPPEWVTAEVLSDLAETLRRRHAIEAEAIKIHEVCRLGPALIALSSIHREDIP